MPIALVFVNILGSALIGWFYLGWFYYYAQGTIYMPYCVASAVVCAILMFLWVAEKGEENQLMLVGFDTGITIKPGTYILANLAPFLREINLQIGFALARVRDGYKLNNESVNVKIFKDQRRTEYSARVTTTSFFALNFDKFWNNVVNFLFDFKGDHDQVQYYKVGRTLFLFTWLATAFCNTFFPSGASPSSQKSFFSFSSSPSQTESGDVDVTVNLAEGSEPVMPPLELFIPRTDNTRYEKIIEGRKYVLFSEPPLGKIRSVVVRESSCFIVPENRELRILTKYPPVDVINMTKKVTYVKNPEYVDLIDELLNLPFAEPGDLNIYATKRWDYVRSNWQEVNGATFGLDVRALDKSKISPKAGGGLVCF